MMGMEDEEYILRTSEQKHCSNLSHYSISLAPKFSSVQLVAGDAKHYSEVWNHIIVHILEVIHKIIIAVLTATCCISLQPELFIVFIFLIIIMYYHKLNFYCNFKPLILSRSCTALNQLISLHPSFIRIHYVASMKSKQYCRCRVCAVTHQNQITYSRIFDVQE